MASHELDYRILGESMQTVEIELDPGETVIAEAGAMNYMTGDIRFTARMGDGSDGSLLGKLWSAGKRKLGGESVFMTHFTNEGQGKQHVAFAAPYPGSVVAVDLDDVGGRCSARRTRSSAQPMAPGSASPSPSAWAPVSSAARASSCRSSRAMAWSSSTPAAR